jgi:hypothetical protein
MLYVKCGSLRKLDVFSPSGDGEDLRDPTDRCFPFHIRTETDSVSETSCFLVSRIPDDGKFKKPSNSKKMLLGPD